jgi:hypothetical protein
MNFIDTLADLATTTAGLALDHIRGLAGFVLAVTLLLSMNTLIHHMVAAQAANATLFDQITKPVPASMAMAQPAPQQQWIPLSQVQQ